MNMKKQIMILLCLSLFSTLFSAEYWFSEKPAKSMKADRPLKIWTFASGPENWVVLPGRRGKTEWDKSGHLKLSSTVKQGKAGGSIFSIYACLCALGHNVRFFSVYHNQKSLGVTA